MKKAFRSAVFLCSLLCHFYSIAGSLRGDGLGFTPNQGQFLDVNRSERPGINYKGSGAGADIYLRETGVSYVFSNASEVKKGLGADLEVIEMQGRISEKEEKRKIAELMRSQTIKMYRVDMEFLGCRKNTVHFNEEETEGFYNYYLAGHPEGILNVKKYNRITYKEIYDRINVSYYGNKTKGLEYDITVNPGGDPGQIKLCWSGAEDIQLEADGKLKVKTGINDFFESIPSVYQDIDGKRAEVKATYLLKKLANSEQGIASNSYEVKFKLGTYNPKLPLVIDPWITYLGGSGDDFSYDIATDNTGNSMVTGSTESSDFPAVAGYTTTNPDNYVEAFVAKFAPAGNLLWATYYGGTGPSTADGITTDKAANIVITGYTGATDFPVLHPAQLHNNSPGGAANMNAFVVKFNSAGVRQWATYYGGSSQDEGFDVATDNNNDVFITGYASSTDFPTKTAGGYLQTIKGGADAFVVEFTAAGALVWATCFGGKANEMGNGIAVDNTGNVIITGYTESSDFPVQAAGVYTQAFGGTQNAFISKFSPASALLWSTWFGGTGSFYGDYGNAVTTDKLGNILVTGSTNSTDFPQLNPFQTTGYGGSLSGASGYSYGDAFISKFSSSNELLWSTYLGGSADEIGWGVVTDNLDNVFVLGDFEDDGKGNYPVTSCAYQSSYGAATLGFGESETNFVAKYDSVGSQHCFTYLGGSLYQDHENGTYPGGGIAVFGNSLYVTGYTTGGYPATAGAFQTVYHGGNADGFVDQLCVNLCEAKTLGLAFSASQTGACIGTAITFTPSVANSCDTTGYRFQWTFTGGNPSSSTAVKPVVTYGSTGSYDVSLVLTTVCTSETVTNSGYIHITQPTVMASGNGNINCSTASVQLTATGDGTSMLWNGGSLVGAANPATVTAAGSYTVIATDANSCTSSSVVTVTSDTNPPSISAMSTGTITCTSANVVLNGTSSSTDVVWNGGTLVNAANPATVTAAGTYTVTAKDDANGCTATATITITADANVPDISISLPDSITCSNSSEELMGSSTTLGASFQWLGGGPAGQNYPITAPGTYTLVVTGSDNCTAQQTVIVPADTSTPKITATQVNPATCNVSNGVAQVTGTAGFIYVWNDGTVGATDGSLASGIYTVTATNPFSGCVASSAVTIGSVGGPSVGIGPVTNICLGESDDGAMSAVSLPGGTTITSYLWSNEQTSSAISGLSVGVYTVTVQDAGGCTATASAAVITLPDPTVTLTASPNTTIVKGESVNLSATGGVNFSWTPAGSLDNAGIQYPTATPTRTTTYIVTVTDADNCSAVDSVKITVTDCSVSGIFVPKAFSPNADGKNDVLYVRVPDCLAEMKFVVFDRWGEQVFISTSPSLGWDGSYQGKQMDDAVFTFYFSGTLTTGQSFSDKGNVTLLR